MVKVANQKPVPLQGIRSVLINVIENKADC